MKLIKVFKMSLSKNVNNYIDDTIRKYIRMISTKHNLDYDDLVKEWVGEDQLVAQPTATIVNRPTPSTPTKSVTQATHITPTKSVTTVVTQPIKKGVSESKTKSDKVETKSSDDTTESLMKLTKQELQERCKKAGVRSSGTKNELVKYLVESKSQSRIKSISTKAPPPFVVHVQQEEKKQEEEKKPVVNSIVRKISSTVPLVNIRRNKFNNYEDVNTGLVFDNLSKKVIGKQNDDGTVRELTKEDINICNKYKFPFVLPMNLDKNTRNDDVKVDELDEDEEGDDEILEEEVEAEPDVEGEIVGDIDIDVEEEDDDDIDDEEELLEEEDVIEDDE